MDTEEVRKALGQEEERLLREMRSIGHENPGVPGGWEPLPPNEPSEPDPVDRAEALSSQEDAAAVLADLDARLRGVRGALARIKEGTYGVCEVCGQAIEPARLTADRAAATCTLHR